MSLSEKLKIERYFETPDEGWSGMSRRCGIHAAKAEKKDKSLWADIFTDAIENGYLVPAGRILANSGKLYSMLLNCFLLQADDSRESLAQTFAEYFIILGEGGGCGLTYSKVRPINAPIGRGGVSSGVLGWGDVHNIISSKIKVGGGRRGATMFSLAYNHPEILDFIVSKNSVPHKDKINELLQLVSKPEHIQFLEQLKDNKRLTETNISVEVDNKFFDCAKNKKDYDLVWNNQVYKTVNGRDVWELMMRNALQSGDPGTMNLGRANHYSNAWYMWDLVGSNPCSEIFIPNYGCCCLSSLNLPMFISNGVFNWDKFGEYIKIGIRFLDNILDTTHYPLQKIRQVSMNERRIGLGYMGLHQALIMLGIKYSSPKALDFVSGLSQYLCHVSYKTSIELSKEKGPFGKFDRNKHLQSNFIKENLTEQLQNDIYKYGIRNVAVNMVAPTGTTSLICKNYGGSFGTSSGIEAIPAVANRRRVRGLHGFEDSHEVHPAVVGAYKAGCKDYSLWECSSDISPEQHFKILAEATRYTDNSISKTIILPEHFSEEKLSDLWLEYGPKCNGVTVYRFGTYANEPIKPIPLTDDLLEKAGVAIEDKCKNGTCDI